MASDYRITQSMLGTRSLANMQRSLQRLQKLQDELSSGKQIQKPKFTITRPMWRFVVC